MRASPPSVITAGHAAFTVQPMLSPMNAIRPPVKDHLGYDRYVVDTGRCFPYFAKHYYCSICLPVCVYNHTEWARDFEGFQTGWFPEVVMTEPPPPVDIPQRNVIHTRNSSGTNPINKPPGNPGTG